MDFKEAIILALRKLGMLLAIVIIVNLSVKNGLGAIVMMVLLDLAKK